jgi:hypothetical protein
MSAFRGKADMANLGVHALDEGLRVGEFQFATKGS